MEKPEEIRSKIARLVEEYYETRFAQQSFIPGKTVVHNSGKVVGIDELKMGVESVLDGWWTEGKYTSELEGRLADYVGTRRALLVNSGSSANLLAVAGLADKSLGEKRIRPGDEVITVAAGFPTTVAPIIQMGARPVFIDVEPIETGRYNVNPSNLENALSEKTKAMIFAHTLGSPFDLKTVKDFADRNNLYLIEDCCDALGSKYNGKRVGSFGDVSTLSFYPAHHITMGEGGAVMTNRSDLAKVIKSYRNWGRDCWCDPGQDNSCGKRFGWKNSGSLPDGYDHKNTFTRLGWNLKATDMQAAIGLGQFMQIGDFEAKRKENFEFLYNGLKKYEERLVMPSKLPESEPSWFGFGLSVRPGQKFTRDKLVDYLTENKVMTRPIFAGNITRHPCMDGVDYRISGDLRNSDEVMNRTFWIGVQPNLSMGAKEYMVEVFGKFFSEH